MYSSLDKCLNESHSLFTRKDQTNDQEKEFAELKQRLVPLTFGRINTTRGKPTPVTIWILFNSGGSGTVLDKKFAKKLQQDKCAAVEWSTVAGKVSTNKKAKIQFSLPELFEAPLIEWRVHLADSLGNYDMIIGRDMLSELGIDLHFSTFTCTWEKRTIPIKDIAVTAQQGYLVEETDPVADSTN